MVISDDTVVETLRHQRKQTLTIHRLRVRLPKVKNIQPLLKKSSDNLVFLNKKIRTAKQQKFHLFVYAI